MHRCAQTILLQTCPTRAVLIFLGLISFVKTMTTQAVLRGKDSRIVSTVFKTARLLTLERAIKHGFSVSIGCRAYIILRHGSILLTQWQTIYASPSMPVCLTLPMPQTRYPHLAQQMPSAGRSKMPSNMECRTSRPSRNFRIARPMTILS